MLRKILDNFIPVQISPAKNLLSDDLIAALPYLKKAMLGITKVFLKQQDEKLPEYYNKMVEHAGGDSKEFIEFFKGPWYPMENYKSYFKEFPDRNPGCAFYPEDLTKEEFESPNNTQEKEQYQDCYTVLRKVNGKLTAIPYHEYYKTEIAEIAEALMQASSKINNNGLKNYLYNRAIALLSGNYRDSDGEWVSLKDSPLEVVLGPFEVYADQRFGIKATYEGFLMINDLKMASNLKEIENNIAGFGETIPLPDGSKASIGKIAPIVVAHQIFSGGEAHQGVMASAFNLPNDPWVRGNIGWKQVMIYNIMQAKFENCTRKIADILVKGGSRAAFEPYFYFVLLHEVSHGLGPAYRKDGTSVAKSLSSHYTAIEEAKADIGALALLLKFKGKFGIPDFNTDEMLLSKLAGLFRSMRFGVHEAHGAANVLQFNWFKEKNVIKTDSTGKFFEDPSNLQKATDELLFELCRLQASGTPEEAGLFLSKYAKPGNDILDALGKLSNVPIDIRVTYTL